jgi:putative ATP-binding cassette transporter
MKMFIFLVKYSPLLFVLSLVSGIVSGASSAGLMALVNDRLAEMSHPDANFFREFLMLAGLAVGSLLAARLLLLRLATRAVRTWRVQLCQQLLRAPLRQIEQQGSAGLMATLTNDIAEVTEALTKFPMQCVNGAVIVACFGYLFWLCWPLALGFMLTMGAGIVTYEVVVRRSRRHMELLRNTWDRLIEQFTALVDGNKELKLNRQRRDKFSEMELASTATTMMNAAWKFNSTFAVAETSGQLFFYFLILSVPVLAPRVQVQDTGIITGFILMLLYMSGRIGEFVGTIPVFHRADVAKTKIESLGIQLGEESLKINPGVATVPAAYSSIEMRQLTYQYKRDGEEDNFVVGPLNVAFKPGEIVFVIGGNGSGKSSFARLLTGLYVPTGGALCLNGVAVDDESRDHYRQHFSAVFADFHLFKNLYEETPEQRLHRAEDFLETLQLSDKVKLTGSAFSTVELSTGQRKRLALLTSFLEDRQVYLFDEWASDQDPAFKQVFYYEILPELAARGKTVVVISHDDHYYRAADRIIRFADGRIIEDRRLELPRAVTSPSSALAAVPAISEAALVA